MPALVEFDTVVLNCADPEGLAAFYQELTGWGVVHRDRDWVWLGEGASVRLGLRRRPGWQPPPRPGAGTPTGPDVRISTLRRGTRDLFEMGASLPEFQPGGDVWVLLADPEGHLFRLTVDG